MGRVGISQYSNMMHYFIVAVCLAGVPSIDAQCLRVQFGAEQGTFTCSPSAPETSNEYGTKCMRINVDGMGLFQRCNGGVNSASVCDAAGNPSTCCSMPVTSQMNQSIICADSFLTAPQASDFSSCDTPCSSLTPGTTTTPTVDDSLTSKASLGSGTMCTASVVAMTGLVMARRA